MSTQEKPVDFTERPWGAYVTVAGQDIPARKLCCPVCVFVDDRKFEPEDVLGVRINTESTPWEVTCRFGHIWWIGF